MKYALIILTIFIGIHHELYSDSDQNTCFLYAPTRLKQIAISSQNLSQGLCKLCKAVQDNNEQEFPLVRTKHFTIMLNIYPYNKGHVMIIANDHVKSINELPHEQRTNLMELISATTIILKKVFCCPGINVGYNEGRCAGASVPDHVHVHVLPRYENFEKSFVHAISNVQVVQWDFRELQQQLKPHFEKLKDQ